MKKIEELIGCTLLSVIVNSKGASFVFSEKEKAEKAAAILIVDHDSRAGTLSSPNLCLSIGEKLTGLEVNTSSVYNNVKTSVMHSYTFRFYPNKRDLSFTYRIVGEPSVEVCLPI